MVHARGAGSVPGLMLRRLARVQYWLFFIAISHCAWRHFISMSVGLSRCRVVAADVGAGSMLAKFLSLLATVRGCTAFPCPLGWVGAGLLLRTLARVQYWLYFLSLLATVRGGTSFLCPTATKKRSKENAFPQSVLSVPSVQTTAFGSRVERCSLEQRTLETLLLTNPYIPTLRHQCSRASSILHGPTRPCVSARCTKIC